MATITHVQDAGKYSGASASVTVKMLNTTAADTLLAAFCFGVAGSVQSVTDSVGNSWIQCGYAANAGSVQTELWQARGIQGGTASVTAVFSTASVGCNVSEWSNCWFQSPLDTWSQNFGTSASVAPQTVSPRTTGELVIAIGNCAASVNGTVSGYTALSVPGNTGFAAAYQILGATQTVPATHWTAASSVASWSAIEAAFLPANSTTPTAPTGPTGVNPLLQFPEVMVQVSQQQNFQAPFQGIGVWTDVTSYVESMTLGPIGRQHELDRVQASSGTFVMNGRDGTFNPWNTQSFLYPYGLDPMTPIKVTAAWLGITSPIYYGYCQAFTPTIIDALNNTVAIATYDILQMASLAYLNNNNYAQALLAGN